MTLKPEPPRERGLQAGFEELAVPAVPNLQTHPRKANFAAYLAIRIPSAYGTTGVRFGWNYSGRFRGRTYGPAQFGPCDQTVQFIWHLRNAPCFP
jgi:hypothetical protein